MPVPGWDPSSFPDSLGSLFASIFSKKKRSKNVTTMRELDSILDGGVEEEVPVDAAASEQALFEEHAARVRAEAEAASSERRLEVAAQQFAEYLAGKQEEMQEMLERVRRAQEALAEAPEGTGATGEDGQGLGVSSGLAPPRLAAARTELDSLLDSLSTASTDLGGVAAQFREEAAVSRRRVRNGVGEKRSRRAQGADAGPRGEAGDETGDEAGEEGGEGVARLEEGGDEPGADAEAQAAPATNPSLAAPADVAASAWREKARWIPMRLDSEERRLLRLLEAALSVSDYTDRVDVLSWRSKTARAHAQVRDVCAILCGLAVAQDYRRGVRLLSERTFSELGPFFAKVFEVGRRYKIMNPDRMRETYGQLMWVLMDAGEPELRELLEFDAVAPLRTVARALEEGGCLALLDDPRLETATMEVAAMPGEPRAAVQRRIRAKEAAREALASRYCSRAMPRDAVLDAIFSLADHNAYLAVGRDPVDRIVEMLEERFDAASAAQRAGGVGGARSHSHGHAPPPSQSLAIHGGSDGARLTHSHARQLVYVRQSLALWREVSSEMFKLWTLTDADLLDPRNRYRLQNTGQGLHRVQAAPRVGAAMRGVLAACQRKLGSWVGSSVVHLGDHNVPNALTFIDKYTQVPRILLPLLRAVEAVPGLYRDDLERADGSLAAYIRESFGGPDAAQALILRDFFRHAFDGSGADNFFDAGSCIDGRLTSAWNWCAKLDSKTYVHLFRLSGFQSFDGDFK